MKRNTGLDLQRELSEHSDEDWLFGASSAFCLAPIPEHERKDFLPPGELQFGREDFMDCATRAPLNILEAKFNYLYRRSLLTRENRLWLVDNGYVTEAGITFSDRFVAINAGTTRRGNSLKAPLEAIRKQGLIPKTMLPASSNMTWSDYHDPAKITKKMRDLGAEFARRFTINYERVYENNYGDLLKEDMLDTAGYAWPKPVNGVYPRVQYTPNHAFTTFINAFYAFDNYIDTDGDYIKHLARDYNFLDYGYRVYISSQNTTPKSTPWLDFISLLRSWLFL